MDIDDEALEALHLQYLFAWAQDPSSPCITWLSALLSALLPLLTNALPRDQNEVCIIPHPHKMERQEAGEETLYLHLGTTGRRPVGSVKICFYYLLFAFRSSTRRRSVTIAVPVASASFKRASKGCLEPGITDRYYYHCSENCDIDFCQAFTRV